MNLNTKSLPLPRQGQQKKKLKIVLSEKPMAWIDNFTFTLHSYTPEFVCVGVGFGVLLLEPDAGSQTRTASQPVGGNK
jgi:hypothetical protein